MEERKGGRANERERKYESKSEEPSKWIAPETFDVSLNVAVHMYVSLWKIPFRFHAHQLNEMSVCTVCVCHEQIDVKFFLLSFSFYFAANSNWKEVDLLLNSCCLLLDDILNIFGENSSTVILSAVSEWNIQWFRESHIKWIDLIFNGWISI